MVAFGEGEQAVLVAEDELVEARQQEWPRRRPPSRGDLVGQSDPLVAGFVAGQFLEPFPDQRERPPGGTEGQFAPPGEVAQRRGAAAGQVAVEQFGAGGVAGAVETILQPGACGQP